MPIEFDITLKDNTVLKYYIPIVLMRGEKEIKPNVNLLPDWAWTNTYYSIKLNNLPSDILEIKLHNSGHIADIESLNDVLIIPEKWDWNKHKLNLKIVEKKKKGKFQKLIKIKK